MGIFFGKGKGKGKGQDGNAASIPMTAIAASCPEENICSLECEKYILNHFNIEFDEPSLLNESIGHGFVMLKHKVQMSVFRV